MNKWMSLLVIILIFVIIRLCENKYKKEEIDHRSEVKKLMKDSLIISIAFVCADFLKDQFNPVSKVQATAAFTGDPKF